MKLNIFRAGPLSETCRVSCQKKICEISVFIGFIIKKYVTKHGHTNVNASCFFIAFVTFAYTAYQMEFVSMHSTLSQGKYVAFYNAPQLISLFAITKLCQSKCSK